MPSIIETLLSLAPMTQNQRAEVAIAILQRGDHFLLQLRDNIPTIVYAGYWGFFGGHLEPGESPEAAVLREVEEEIGYVIPSIKKFGIYADEKVIRHVFHAPLKVEPTELTLTEGWDMGLWSRKDIERGEKFSAIANQIRPLGDKHQQILLDFIASDTM